MSRLHLPRGRRPPPRHDANNTIVGWCIVIVGAACAIVGLPITGTVCAVLGVCFLAATTAPPE